MLILTQLNGVFPEEAHLVFRMCFGHKNEDKDNRRNNILLQFIKWCLKHKHYEYARSTHASQIYESVLHILDKDIYGDWQNFDTLTISSVPLEGKDRLLQVNSLRKPLHCGGLHDDPTRIKYYDMATDRVLVGRPARWFMYVINNNPSTQDLPEQVKNYLGEQFAAMWIAYSNSQNGTSGLTLQYGSNESDFRHIYESDNALGNFHSCMMDDERYYYYKCVDATAAWLEDRHGNMVARCVIFNKVRVVDDDTKTYRLAERQYASDEFSINHNYVDTDKLKRILVDMLIKENLIDGYKSIGVDCHATQSYHSNDGTMLDARGKLYIDVDTDILLSNDGVTSYQDSFIYFDPKTKRAYNNDLWPYTFRLDTNDTDVIPYDDYHHEYTLSYCVQCINSFGHFVNCSEDRLEDFTFVEGLYVHDGYLLTYLRKLWLLYGRERRYEIKEYENDASRLVFLD